MAMAGAAKTQVLPGEQKLQVTLAMVFELQMTKKGRAGGSRAASIIELAVATSGRSPCERG